MTPSALKSVAAITAVDRRPAASIALPAASPLPSRLSLVSKSRLSSAAMPWPVSASRYASSRSRVSGWKRLPTKAIRRCPCCTRWSTAWTTPLRLSGRTTGQEKPAISSLSRTTGFPASRSASR